MPVLILMQEEMVTLKPFLRDGSQAMMVVISVTVMNITWCLAVLRNECDFTHDVDFHLEPGHPLVVVRNEGACASASELEIAAENIYSCCWKYM